MSKFINDLGRRGFFLKKTPSPGNMPGLFTSPSEMAKRCQPGSVVLILFAFLLFNGGCGRKGPPVPPETIIPPAIKDLKAEVVRQKVWLSWSVPTKNGSVFDGIEGFEVFRHKAGDSTEICSGCPIPFSELAEIKLVSLESSRIEGNAVTFYDRVEPGYRYAYKVRVHHESGGVSNDSNIVKVSP